MSVPHDVLGSGGFIFRSLSFIFPSLTADITSNQWGFWITAGVATAVVQIRTKKYMECMSSLNLLLRVRGSEHARV